MRGAERFHWSVLVPAQSHTVGAGHIGGIARAHSLAEMALRAFVEDWHEQSGGQSVMANRSLRGLFWRVADVLVYPLVMVWLRILDALAGSLPETPADQQRR